MVVYQILFPNGKKYIGCTSRTLDERQRGHKHKAFTDKLKLPLQYAMRKYGWENLQWSILFETQDHTELLNKEIELIASENTLVPSGYNVTKGGEGTLGFTHCLGKKYSAERKAEMSKAQTLLNGKKCVLVDCEKKEFHIFNSIAELARFANVGYTTAKMAIKSKSPTLYHYKAFKLENFDPNMPDLYFQKKAHNALIFKITNGVESKEMRSINELIKFLEVSERQARNLYYKNQIINGWRKE